MAKKSLTKKISYLLTMALCCLLSFVMFFMTACASPADPDDDADVDYTYTDVDDGTIANANFSFGQADTEYKNFPKSSVNGWALSVDNGATSSDIPSGVVDVTNDGWEQLYKNLYKKSGFLSYLQKRYGYNETDVKNAVDTTGMTEEEADEAIFNYVKEHFIEAALPNPGRATSTVGDTNVYMINNFDDTPNFATAQKIQSSSTVVVEAGKIAKLSVWVKTINLRAPHVNDYGANIRLINSFNGATQAEYKISNIQDTEWTEYSIYVEADDDYECSFTLVLGLGYGNGSANTDYAVEGTAYFDNITYEIVDDFPTGVTVDKMNISAEEGFEKSVIDIASQNEGIVAAYDMSIKNSYPAGFFNTINFATLPAADTTNDNYYYTKSNITVGGEQITGKKDNSVVTTALVGANASEYPYAAQTLDLDITKAGYTVNIKNGNFNFIVAPKNYTYVSFYMNIEADAFASADATVYLHDVLKYGSNVIDEKRNVNVVVSDTDGEWKKVSFVIENNFEDALYNDQACTREFYFEIVFGPTSIATVVNDYELASGKIKITQPLIATGTEPEEDDDIYDFYSFITKSVNSSVSLYAGFANSNAWDDTEAAATYSFIPSNAQIGTIVSQPANIDSYRGVVANHAFVNNVANAENKINTRSGAGDADGNVAGLINTKYIDNYANSTDIKAALDYDNSKTDIQPLMIFNNTVNSYGFIGDRTTIAPGAYAQVTAKIKISKGSNTSATPFAYVYLVDSYSFDVMHFEDFTVNTSLGHTNLKNTSVVGAENNFALKVTEDMSNATADGWVTVNFYIATGATEKNFRVEVWNGSRDDTEKSSGYVFVESIKVTTSNAFVEATRWNDTFNQEYALANQSFNGQNDNLYIYQRELTDTEKQFNADYPDKAISYNANYVWAKNDTTVYAIYNTIDPIVSDPYANIPTEDDGNGCAATSNPSTFWLSFSSIVIASALVLAVIALIVKTIVRKRKANASDAKSHFTVTSRIKTKKDAEKKVEKNKKKEATHLSEEDIEETYTATVESTNEETTNDSTEQTANLDDYVYGDVQSFGSQDDTDQND